MPFWGKTTSEIIIKRHVKEIIIFCYVPHELFAKTLRTGKKICTVRRTKRSFHGENTTSNSINVKEEDANDMMMAIFIRNKMNIFS